MSNGLVRGKTLLVGAETSKMTTLRRDFLLYDGFVDEDDGEDFPETYSRLLKQLPKLSKGLIDISNEKQFPFLRTWREASELSSLGFLKSFSDLGIESEELNMEAAIAGLLNVSNSLNSGNTCGLNEYKGHKARHINTVENELVFDATNKLINLQANAIPRFKHDSSNQSSYQSNVLNVVLNKFPFPSDDIPMAKILDFKNEQDSIRKLGSLNVLIARFTREKASPEHVEQEIDQLILEAKSVMKASKFNFRESMLTKIVRVTEATIKGNLGELLQRRDKEKAEKKVALEIGMTMDEISLMQTEIASEWKHVAYLLKADSLSNR